MRRHLVAAALAWLAPLAAQAYTDLDYIVAVVDDDIVLASELVSRLESVRKQMQASDVPLPPNDVLVNQLLERLIMETIQLQMGERAGVRIDDQTLTQALESIAAQNNMNLEQFTQALAEDGIDYREFREDVRREMVIARVQRSRVNGRVYISDEEINAFLESPLGRAALSDEYRVGHILLAIADDAEPGAIAAAEAKAAEIYEALKKGADFRQMAIANSADSRALEGGDLGWRKAGELPSLFAEQVVGLEVGDTAPPIRSGSGLHVVQLLDKRGASTEVVEQTLVSHILVKPSEIRSEEETKALIDDIYRRVQGGESFADLARRYSEDPGSGLAGGDLGWSEPEKFVPEFADVMRSLTVDQVSQPFRTQFGWHVLEVRGRRQQDMSEEARRNQAIRVLHSRRFEEELQEWLREIRDEAFVEVRLQGTGEQSG
jgi:peptidyl-prolyl cis-trans isomerase SurA